MKKVNLPDIVETAKSRPLSYDPKTEQFIYYDKVEKGAQKIIPLDKLSQEQLLKLAVERKLSDVESTTITLNGEVFTNKQLAKEMKRQSKIGKQMFLADIDYLKFYLSQFPQESFER